MGQRKQHGLLLSLNILDSPIIELLVSLQDVARYGHHMVATVLKKFHPQNQLMNIDDIFEKKYI